MLLDPREVPQDMSVEREMPPGTLVLSVGWEHEPAGAEGWSWGQLIGSLTKPEWLAVCRILGGRKEFGEGLN